VPPPRGSTLRVSRHPDARFHCGCPILDIALRADDRVLQVSTPRGEFEFDFLIVSTGFKVDWDSRAEFAAIAPHVRAWKDRFTPPPGDEDAELADSPDLGPVF